MLQVLTPVSLSLTPLMLARADAPRSPFSVDRARSLAALPTVPYTLRKGETVSQVARRHGMTVSELKKLNQLRTFARGFDHLRAGDELDVPAAASAPKSPFSVDRPQDADDAARQLASTASRAGSFIAGHGGSREAASMAKGMAVGRVNEGIQSWASQFGNARVQLGVDEDFSLKHSAFDLLHPWHETDRDLVFSQTGIHRTDDRTQTNIGVGYRHFRPTDMIGSNLFIDYDLSRDHARTGFGAEYWRDFLKLSANAYVGLTGWKTSPDVEDYEERPASGWDLRAEGYLPAYPQLGAKMVYEQYYGKEVGLFGKDERQKNPHALTAGLSWTPFPLLKLSAEHRAGKSGENDTRFGAELSYRIGEPLSAQLDPGAVGALRSLAGSRHDFIDRNNDIVLEYRKLEVISLSLPARVEGRALQQMPLTLSVKAKHGLKDIQWDDAALLAAGGKLTGAGQTWQLTLPTWHAGTANTWPLSAVAHDSRGNTSERAEMQVVVTGPSVNTGRSSVATKADTLLADGKTSTDVLVTLQDEDGNPVSGMADQITLKGTLTADSNLVHGGAALKAAAAGTEPVLGKNLKETAAGSGVYTTTLTAGTQAGTYDLTATVGDTVLKTAKHILFR